MCYPKPTRRVPIHIGGHSRVAARRAGRLGDGFQPLGVGGPELSGLLEVMRSAAHDAGRDPDTLEVSLGHLVAKVDAERAGRLAELGADRLVLAMPPVTDVDEAAEVLSACAQRLGLAT
jgi:alkanesulfonate monooxygenase SsuD/methylene tetrahydromethanopterin reductase-like flavin-dependent oxidoreductase (luciferase family)